MSRNLLLQAPSRLHFGLLSFGRPERRQYGGVGMMIQQPAIALRITGAPKFEIRGLYADRIQEFAEHWLRFYGQTEAPACCLDLITAPRQHIGLGVGTQLALSVAAALHAWREEPVPPPAQLARSVRRGVRSAIGAYGFVEGGLIVERGKLADETLSPLDCRLDLPEAWRVVLVSPTQDEGLSGPAEGEAFTKLPPVPEEVSQRLLTELRSHLLPAAARGDFDTFAESVFTYGREAGLCFAAAQGGAYNGPIVEELVATLLRLGARGVGQSSWGPTVFALQPDAPSAESLVARLRTELKLPADVIITGACNQGARLVQHP